MIDPAIIRVIEQYFSAKISGLSLLGQGLCNTVYAFTISDRKYCVKIERADKETNEQNDILVESRIIQEIFQKGVTRHVPEIFLVDSEHRLYVYDYFEGSNLENFSLLNNTEMEDLFLRLGAFHASLDCLTKEEAQEIGMVVDETGTSITEFFSNDKIADLPKDWDQKWVQVVHSALRIYATTKPGHCQCIHNDAHDRNIFVTPNMDNFRVIDFGDAMYGDVHLDFVSYVHAYPDYWRFAIEGFEKASGKSLSRERLIALALMRHLKGLIKMWNEQSEREHVSAKMKYYCTILNLNFGDNL